MKILVMLPGLLQRRTIKNCVEDLLNGNIVAGIKDFDNRTRILQKNIIKSNRKKMDFIVLGSSRSFYIKDRFLKSRCNFFNHSLGGATLEDHISLVGMYKKYHNYIPKKIMIGIDPWIFNINNGIDRWKCLSGFYNSMIKEINTSSNIKTGIGILDRFKQLFVFDETTSFMYYLNIKNRLNYYVTTDVETDDWLIFPDGSVMYPYLYRYTDKEKALRKAAVVSHRRVFGLEGFYKLSYTELFERFVDYLLLNNVELYFFLHPYHPVSYGNFINNDKYKIIADLEKYLIHVASEKNIEVFGSYNPAVYGFENEDFFDKMHGYEHVVEDILAGSRSEFSPWQGKGVGQTCQLVKSD